MRIKPHKSVEQIARKHRMDVSDIQNQLDMGVPIEHEHTRNKTLATDIALQHLDEIPDYYTRLKKMEASARKEHKKFKDVKEDAVTDLQRGITELPDASYGSIDSLMRRIMKKRKMSAKQLHNDFVDKHNQTPDTWAKKNMKEDLRLWFGKNDEGGVGGGGWDRYNSKGERIGKCAKKNPNEPKPKCLSKKKASQLRSQGGAKAIANAVTRKRKQDPISDRSGKGGKPIMVSNKIKEEYIQEKNVPTNPSLWSRMKSRAKSKFDVYPSAYANGWAAKEYKKAGGGWKTVNEGNLTQEAANAVQQQAAIAINMKEKGIKPKSEVKEDCWVGYRQKGVKKKGKKMVPNCVPVNSESTDSLDYTWNTPIRERADRYCPKCEKLERRSECKYGPKYWDMFSLPAEVISSKKDYNITMPHPGNMPEEKDHEYSMARSELDTITNAAQRLKKKRKGEGNIEAWVQSKITKAADYIDTAADYIDSRESKVNENVDIEDASGNTFLRVIDIIRPVPLKATKGIGNRLVGESISNEPKLKPVSGLGGGKLIYQKGKEPKPTGAELPKLPLAKGEGGSPYEPYNAPKENPKNPYVPAPKRPKVQLAHYEFEGNYVDEQVSDTDTAQEKFDRFDRRVNAAKAPGLTPALRVKILKSASEIHPSNVKTLESFMIEASAAWQRKEGKNPEGGLNKKGIASYRKENPGSNLSLAVTTKPSKLKKGSKSANRRKSYCSRSAGQMKMWPKAAKDPNSRLRLARKKWNC